MNRPETPSSFPHVNGQLLFFYGLGAMILFSGALGCVATTPARIDVPSVKEHLAKGQSVEATDWKQRSLLELAIILKRDDVVDLLITEGVDVNRQGKGSRTPLIWASMQWGSPEVINKLIDAGADPNGTDKAGQTPLFFAVLDGTPHQIEALIARGADVNHVLAPKWRTTVLHVAIQKKKVSAVELLVAAGADENATDTKGRTAREQALRRTGMSYAIDRGLERRAKGGIQIAMRSPSAPQASTAAPIPVPIPVPTHAPKPAPRRAAKTRATAVAPVPSRVPAVSVVPAPAPRAPIAPAGPRMQVAMVPSARLASDELRLGQYHALVIGNDDYVHLPKLRTAVNDAKSLSALLRDRYRYEVTTLLNASRSDILQALAQYRKILGPNDNLLIYYAGHGWLDEEADRGYWLPIDATQEDDVFWIANESITSKTRAMDAKHVMVIADSCYSGKLVRGIHVNQGSPSYLKRLATRKARVVLTSGGIEPVSDAGGRDNHSVFAAALLQVLNENNDVLEGHELFTKVRRPVALNSDQIPEYSDMRKAGHDGGDFLFILP